MTPGDDGASGPAIPGLVLGGHLTGLGVIRLLAARAVPALVAGVGRDDLVAHSRWFRAAPGDLGETAGTDALAGFLSSRSIDRAVLLPCTDAWTRAVAGLPGDLRERYPASVPSLPVVEGFTDKDRFSALVASLGIPSPRSRPIDALHDLTAVSDDEIASGFLKPVDSQRFSSRFEGKGLWARDRSEATRLVAEARSAGVGLLLQEWIPGDASHNVLIDCFVDRYGAITGMVARRKVRRHPWLLGNTASAVTIALSEVADAVAVSRRMIDAVGHRGIFSAEFKFDARDGRFKILEVNTRLFWYVAHTAAAGLDLAWMTYLDALGRPVPRVTSYRTGLYGLYEINDAAAIWGAWRSGNRPIGAILRPWLRGNRALFWWRDPGPAAMEVAGDLRRRLGRVGRSGPAAGSAGERQDLPGSQEHQAEPGADRNPADDPQHPEPDA